MYRQTGLLWRPACRRGRTCHHRRRRNTPNRGMIPMNQPGDRMQSLPRCRRSRIPASGCVCSIRVRQAIPAMPSSGGKIRCCAHRMKPPLKPAVPDPHSHRRAAIHTGHPSCAEKWQMSPRKVWKKIDPGQELLRAAEQTVMLIVSYLNQPGRKECRCQIPAIGAVFC